VSMTINEIGLVLFANDYRRLCLLDLLLQAPLVSEQVTGSKQTLLTSVSLILILSLSNFSLCLSTSA
jgi:hypothetical protein